MLTAKSIVFCQATKISVGLFLSTITAHCLPLSAYCFLIRFKFLLPAGVILKRLLLALIQDAILQYQNIDSSSHEAAIRILRRADDRLVAHVERCVDQQTAAGFCLKGFKQLVVSGIC